jgi:LAO/AO transport system kinase
VLDAAGKDLVTIETVGVGQDEVEIVRMADVSVVVLVPGMGDEVQALKAGIMEIADVFVVNKSDREGADLTVAEVESLLALQTYQPADWRPPIVKTEATTGTGVETLIEAIDRFRGHAGSRLAARRRERAGAQLRAILVDRMMRRVASKVTAVEMEQLIDRIAARTIDPYTAADEIS